MKVIFTRNFTAYRLVGCIVPALLILFLLALSSCKKPRELQIVETDASATPEESSVSPEQDELEDPVENICTENKEDLTVKGELAPKIVRKSVFEPTAQVFLNEANQSNITSNFRPFSQNSFAFSAEHFYVTYYNGTGNLVLTRRKIVCEGNECEEWEKIVFPYTQTQSSASRPTSVAISSDGRIHIIWGLRAGGTGFNYIFTPQANSINEVGPAFSANLFSENRNFLSEGEELTGVSYPRFVQGENNTLYLIMRQNLQGINSIVLFLNQNGIWGTSRRIIGGNNGTYLESDRRNAYLNTATFGSGKLHLTWTWRETTADVPIPNHDLMHAYTEDGGFTWRNAEGAVVADENSLPIELATNTKFADLDYSKLVANQCGQTMDSLGGVHSIHRHDQGYFYRHWASVDNGWSAAKNITLPNSTVLERPVIERDLSNNLYVLSILDQKLALLKAAKMETGWDEFKVIHNEPNGQLYMSALPFIKNGRIFIVGQQQPAALNAASSALELIEFDLAPKMETTDEKCKKPNLD